MDKDEFIKSEYENLRMEIRHVRSRLFTLSGTSLMILPAALSLADKYSIGPLIILIPFLITALVSLYFSESKALMRLGSYIKHNIEPYIETKRASIGWEHWLSGRNSDGTSRRKADILLVSYFYIVFLIYYVVASYLSVTYIQNTKELEFLVGYDKGIYGGLGIILTYIFAANINDTIDTTPTQEGKK